jgi:hypothetical protein
MDDRDTGRLSVAEKHIVAHTGDALAAGGAVGFGVKILADVELIVSIIAGLLVAASAGLSLYLNWRDRVKDKKDDS